jgi:hypothetical protein
MNLKWWQIHILFYAYYKILNIISSVKNIVSRSVINNAISIPYVEYTGFASLLIKRMIHNIFSRVSMWIYTRFGLVIGFIELLQNVTTSKHIAIANLHILQLTAACIKSLLPVSPPVIIWQRLSTPQLPQLSCSSPYWPATVSQLTRKLPPKRASTLVHPPATITRKFPGCRIQSSCTRNRG